MENHIAVLNAHTAPAHLSLVSPGTQGSKAPDRPVNVAVFGAGRWGTHLLRNFLQHPYAQVVAVVDPFIDRLNALAQRFNLDDQVLLAIDGTQAMQHAAVEAVIIATPATSHYSLIKAALQRGHHVLAEKPLTLEVAESLELCRLAALQHRQLVIDHTYLFHPAVSRGQGMIRQGGLGEMRYGYATRTHLGPVRQDVDALWDLAIHDIAIFNFWLGETPIQVQAQGTGWLQSATVSDLVWIKLTYPSGFQAFIHLCWSNPDKQRRLCVVGSQGTLVFDELSTTPLMLQNGKLEAIDQQFVPIDQMPQPIAIEPIEPLQAVCTHFLDCVRFNQPSPISSGWLGTCLVEILAALTLSLQQNGRPIDIASMAQSA